MFHGAMRKIKIYFFSIFLNSKNSFSYVCNLKLIF